MGSIACEICIIGGGYTGLSAAYHLAGLGHDVVLLEARRIGWGASGRNGGQIHSGHCLEQNVLERSYGADAARALWRVSEDAKALLRELIARHRIDCDLRPGLLYGIHRARLAEDTERYVAKLRDAYGYTKIEYLGRDEMRRRVASEDYHGGYLDQGGGHFHPLKFALGLKDAALGAGARLYEFSAATRVTRDQPVIVETAQARIRARRLLFACNGHFDGLAPDIEEHILPINSYILATEPMTAKDARALIRGGEAVFDSRKVVNYYRLAPDNRLLFGGGESWSMSEPEDVAGRVRTAMLKVFPQLAQMRIDYAWGGRVAMTYDHMPYFRRLGPNVLAACGYGGHGVALAIMAGKIIAEDVSGDSQRFELMANLDTPRFPGGRMLRQPLMAAGRLWYSVRDRI